MKKDRSILITSDLSAGYIQKGETDLVLSRLSLELKKGELTCLLGANGSGKSTLMRTLAGIQKPLSGSIFLGHERLERIKAKILAKKLSLVLPNALVPGNLTAYALVTLGRYPYTGWLGTLSADDKKITQWAMEVTGTLPFANKHMGELSDGERQKVMIARTLAQDTPVIFLDEPTAHLDLPNRLEIFHLLKTLAQDSGKAILLTTHELDMALANADQLWLVQPGKEVVCGVPEDLVLNGVVEQAFIRENILFDYETASFKRKTTQGKKAYVTGNGLPKQWTQRALERKGYVLSNDKNADIRIEVKQEGKAYLWQLNPQEEIYQSIKQLLTTIEKIFK